MKKFGGLLFDFFLGFPSSYKVKKVTHRTDFFASLIVTD
jgi:hypothetical protein